MVLRVFPCLNAFYYDKINYPKTKDAIIDIAFLKDLLIYYITFVINYYYLVISSLLSYNFLNL